MQNHFCLEGFHVLRGLGNTGGPKNYRVGKKREAKLGVFRQDVIRPGLQLCLFSRVSFFHERGSGQSRLDKGLMK